MMHHDQREGGAPTPTPAAPLRGAADQQQDEDAGGAASGGMQYASSFPYSTL